MNPWLDIDLEAYEKHMSHKDVCQLQTLSRIVNITARLFQPQKILVLGAAAGNGFGHFNKNAQVYAVDINSSFLNVCSERFKDELKVLKLINIDVNIEPLPLDNNSIDLVICHLFLEYVDKKKIIDEIDRVLIPGGIANVVIQRNNDLDFVSNTGFTGLEVLSTIAEELEPEKAEELFLEKNFFLLSKIEEPLPNGKSFLIYNFRKA